MDFVKKMFTDREAYGFPAQKIFEDKDGCELRVGVYCDNYVPPFGVKFYEQIKSFQVKDDDVFLCGYPKTGCHWTWEILRMILAQNDKLTKLGKCSNFMELAGTEELNKLSSPRVLNTHMWFDFLPEQIFQKKSKIIFTTRNPKDTASSYYNHHYNLKDVYGYNGKFNSWFELFMEGKVDYGSYLDYHLSWYNAIRAHPGQPIFIARFENMKEDLPREIRAMAKFLEIDLSDEVVESIAKAAGFESMQKTYTGSTQKLLRKGQVGDWKNWLTVAQSELIDKEIDGKLSHTDFRYRYTLD